MADGSVAATRTRTRTCTGLYAVARLLARSLLTLFVPLDHRHGSSPLQLSQEDQQ